MSKRWKSTKSQSFAKGVMRGGHVYGWIPRSFLRMSYCICLSISSLCRNCPCDLAKRSGSRVEDVLRFDDGGTWCWCWNWHWQESVDRLQHVRSHVWITYLSLPLSPSPSALGFPLSAQCSTSCLSRASLLLSIYSSQSHWTRWQRGFFA